MRVYKLAVENRPYVVVIEGSDTCSLESMLACFNIEVEEVRALLDEDEWEKAFDKQNLTVKIKGKTYYYDIEIGRDPAIDPKLLDEWDRADREIERLKDQGEI